jgi:hypothetical protein
MSVLAIYGVAFLFCALVWVAVYMAAGGPLPWVTDGHGERPTRTRRHWGARQLNASRQRAGRS